MLSLFVCGSDCAWGWKEGKEEKELPLLLLVGVLFPLSLLLHPPLFPTSDTTSRAVKL
jgi:hypothetical protein